MAPSSSLLSERERAAWKGLLATHSRLVHELDAELERQHGLPLSSYEVLMNLADAEGNHLRMGELANRLLLSKSGITRLADRLEKQGLIARRRCDDDGRGYFAELTDAGRELVTTARPDHLAAVRRRFVDRLEPAEIDELGRIWERFENGDGASAD